jgi:hypothetical protein
MFSDAKGYGFIARDGGHLFATRPERPAEQRRRVLTGGRSCRRLGQAHELLAMNR